jgi:1-phosphofructokinase family hexose kinase
MIYTLTLNPAVDRELTVPAMEFDAVLRAAESRVDFGGKGFNVSRLLKNLDTPSTAVGFLGGRSGELLQDGLRGLGIGADFVWIPGETRTNISIVTEPPSHYIKVNEKGPPVEQEKQDELLAKIDSIASPGDWWVLAGSLPPCVGNDFYAQIVKVLNRHGAKAVLDTTGETLRLGCAEHPYLVKPNAEEAGTLTGFPVETLAQIPIGAGDSMVGGLVWALKQGRPLRDSLAWGVASGAATASLGGTEIGSRALIEELLEQVTFQEISESV